MCSAIRVIPPLALAEPTSSSIHARLIAGGSGSSKTKRSGMDGCSQIVLRPVGSSSGCRHDTVKLSSRRSLVAMTTFRWDRARSSMWIGVADPP